MSQWRRIDKKSISTPDFEGFKKIVYRNCWNTDIPIQNATGNLRDKAFAWYVAIYSPMDLNAKKYRVIARYTSDVPCGMETPEKLGNDKPIPPSILRTYLEEKKKELAEPLTLHVSWKKQINVKDIYATDVDGDQCSFDFELEEPGIPFETDNLGCFEPLGVFADDFKILSVMIQYPDKVKSIANAHDTISHLVTCRDFQNDVKNKYWDEKIDDAKDDMFSWQSKLEKLDKDFEKSSENAARALNKLSSKFNIEFSDIDVDSTIMVYSWMTPLKWKIGDQNPNMRVTGNSKSFLLPPMGFSDLIRKAASLNYTIRKYEDDLIDYGRLRNAIIHNSDDFVIAEPHDSVVENIEHIGVIAGAMIGAVLGNKNTYLVKRGTTCNVLPGSVIFSATAFMNGNVIDLAVPFENKTRILR